MEQSSVMAAPGALRAALMRKQLASALPYLNARNQLLETRVEKWRTISLQLGSWYDREYNEEDVVKGYVSTGRTFTTRNLAGSCTRTETSLG
jgi:hypothetical protein